MGSAKRLSRQRRCARHEKGARASQPSAAVLRTAGAKVAQAVVGARRGVGPGVVRKLDGWSRGRPRPTSSSKRFDALLCRRRFLLFCVGADRHQIRTCSVGSSRSRGVIARERSLLLKHFLFGDNGLLQLSQIGKTTSVAFVQDLGEVPAPRSGQSAQEALSKVNIRKCDRQELFPPFSLALMASKRATTAGAVSPSCVEKQASFLVSSLTSLIDAASWPDVTWSILSSLKPSPMEISLASTARFIRTAPSGLGSIIKDVAAHVASLAS